MRRLDVEAHLEMTMRHSAPLGWFLALGLALAVSADGRAETAEQKLDGINVLARAHYTKAKEQALTTLGPIIVVDSDSLTIVRAGTQRRETYLPARYRDLKALGHLA